MCVCVCVYGFSGGAVVKNAPANAGGIGLIPGSGRSPGVGNGNTLQYYTMHMYMYYILYIYIYLKGYIMNTVLNRYTQV